jgi:hypothetical protein
MEDDFEVHLIFSLLEELLWYWSLVFAVAQVSLLKLVQDAFQNL